jgi:hypothetical protein
MNRAFKALKKLDVAFYKVMEESLLVRAASLAVSKCIPFFIEIYLFKVIYKNKVMSHIFRFYGSHVSDYYCHKGGKSEFWLSEKSLYWHLWRQRDIDKFASIAWQNEKISSIIGDSKASAVELGFGIGKNHQAVFYKNGLKEYIAVEPNVFVDKFINQRSKNLKVLHKSTMAFMETKPSFDFLILCGGVLMYFSESEIDSFLNFCL